MEESVSDFPFRKLLNEKLLTLEVMMYVRHPKIYKFMFDTNKATRAFLHDNFTTIQNGFTNESLIVYHFNGDFNDYLLLEKLYLKALKRLIGHRTINIQV